VAPVHDFVRKLRQEGLRERVADYVAWQRARRQAVAEGRAGAPLPAWSPLSINLDLTTACNYACGHCIDWDILNSGISHDDRRLRASLAEMASTGLRSVILIGGGEPTVYPGFVAMVRFLKAELGLQVAVVSNGSRNDRLLEVVDLLDERDWIRLSLDAGTDATFQAMHRPRRPIALEEICAGVARLKERNPAPRVGFSFVIVWRGAQRSGDAVEEAVENVEEIAEATRLARQSGFDYISFKPFLTRAPDGAEVLAPDAARDGHAAVVARIRRGVDEALALATPAFAVVESTNLKVLEAGTWRDWTRQPRPCPMPALPPVLSPRRRRHGPAPRGGAQARVAGPEAVAPPGGAAHAAQSVEAMLDAFDASRECAEVTCLYHAANWWIEQAIEDPRAHPLGPSVAGDDAFL
jgi:pyruvate-formate lyase-activating enzyme